MKKGRQGIRHVMITVKYKYNLWVIITVSIHFQVLSTEESMKPKGYIQTIQTLDSMDVCFPFDVR